MLRKFHETIAIWQNCLVQGLSVRFLQTLGNAYVGITQAYEKFLAMRHNLLYPHVRKYVEKRASATGN